MTLEETRRLEIEFERRVQTMIPEKEYAEKLDTETIESYLNQYQDKYVHEIYRNLDKIQPGSNLSAHVESVLQSLMDKKYLKISDTSSKDNTRPVTIEDVVVGTGRSVTYTLPDDFYMYIRSVSKVSKTFSFKADVNAGADKIQQSIRVVPNQLTSQSDVWKLIETTHDSLRILRYPAAVLDKDNTITVIYDQYTEPKGIEITYYKQPDKFSLFTGSPCKLPIDSFEELVSGAVDLYVQYVAGAEVPKSQFINPEISNKSFNFEHFTIPIGYSKIFTDKVKFNIQHLVGNEKIDGINPKLMKDIMASRHHLDNDNWGYFKRDIGPRRYKNLVAAMARVNLSTIDAKVSIDLKRILRLPSSLHSKVSMKCMEVKNRETFDPLDKAVPKFVYERKGV